MNATARASLIAVSAIAAACWAVPALLVGAVPPDAGMFTTMALLYQSPRSPSACSPRAPCERSSGCLRRSGPPSPSYFPSRSRAARTSRSTASSISPLDTSPWGCTSAWPSGVAHHVEPDVHNQMSIKGRTGPALSVRLPDLRCACEPFSMRHMVHRRTELFKAPRS